MELKEALEARRSIRRFTEEAVSEEDITELLHAAMSGPSACNMTPWQFYVVTNPAVLAKPRGATRYSGISAPLAVVVAGNLSGVPFADLAAFWVQDCSAATENILLRAVDLGLGAVWCGVHPQKAAAAVSEILELPEKVLPLNIVYIGHPAEHHRPRDQYKAEAVRFIR